jgi:hypothetical protein
MAKNLIEGPVDSLVGNPSNRGTQDKAVIAKYPRSSNSGVPEKQFDKNMPNPPKSFNPSKDLFKTPVNE